MTRGTPLVVPRDALPCLRPIVLASCAGLQKPFDQAQAAKVD
jgi:hypothetical protein